MLFLEYPSFQGKKAAKAFFSYVAGNIFFSNFMTKRNC